MGRGKEGRESPYLDRLRRDANDIERFHFCVRKRQPHGATDRVCGDERNEEKRNRDSRKRRDLVTREPEGAREETDCSDTEADAEQRDLLEMMRRQSCVHAGACCARKYNGVAGDTIHVAFASPYADVLLDSLGSSSGAGARPVFRRQPEDQDWARGPVRDALRNAAKRGQAAEPAAPDDQQIRVAARVEKGRDGFTRVQLPGSRPERIREFLTDSLGVRPTERLDA